jgi:hypothetical protein
MAIMLSRLKTSVANNIAAYLSPSDRTFRKTRYRVTVKGRTPGCFDAEELVQAVKEVVKLQGLQEDALLMNTATAVCKA